MLRQLNEVESSQLSTDLSSTPNLQNATPLEALKATKALLGCYRTGEAIDPVRFGGAIAVVLSDYPLNVIRYVCDPRTGLPSTSKWMPNAAEVRAACEARAAWLAKMDRFENWGKNSPTVEQPPPTEAERDRVSHLVADLKRRLERGSDEEYEAKQRRQREENAAALKAQTDRARREYAAQGIVPPSPLALSITARKDMALRDEILTGST